MQIKDRTSRSGAAGAGGGGQSTRSSIEGSLLRRVEVLEDALETLLAAQEVRCTLAGDLLLLSVELCYCSVCSYAVAQCAAVLFLNVQLCSCDVAQCAAVLLLSVQLCYSGGEPGPGHMQ